MTFIDFWFDPISPYAYLAFERLPDALEGLSYTVNYRPVLFGGLLKHWDHKGPAEIAPKRDWTYRQVLWTAHRHAIDMQMPKQHPFNPLALLRLAYACAGPPGLPNRHVCRTILHHVWRGGGDPVDAARLAQLTQLRASTDQAIGLGIFGVPTVQVEQRLFWGLDALEMVAASLRGDPWFDAGGGWDQAAAPRPGLQRAG
jgi:2-hydroxychromene-2-carboxylate isomerase